MMRATTADAFVFLVVLGAGTWAVAEIIKATVRLVVSLAGVA
jgi:hypothetical protein